MSSLRFSLFAFWIEPWTNPSSTARQLLSSHRSWEWRRRALPPRDQCGSFPVAVGVLHSSGQRRGSNRQDGEGMPACSQKTCQGQNRNLQGHREPLGGPGGWYHLRKESGTRHRHRLSPPVTPHETALSCPERQLSHKSTHWVSPSNQSNPAGKQHIRPLTAPSWLFGWEVVF